MISREIKRLLLSLSMGIYGCAVGESVGNQSTMAGVEMVGVEMAGIEMAGIEMAGVEMAGIEMAGVEMAGVEMAGIEMAGVEMDEIDFGYNLCGMGASQARATGDNSEPIIATYSPFLDRNDTTNSTQDIYNTYDCAPDRREFGREVVYQFTMPVRGYFRAEVLDPLGVDIDLHLLQNPTVDANGLVSGCLTRNDRIIEVEDLSAGTYQVVADSWTNVGGIEYEGQFEIAFEWLPENRWTEAPLRQGMTLKRFYGTFAGEHRLVHAVVVDSGYDIEAKRHNGCESVPNVLARQNAIIGINANFFDVTQRCAPTDFLKDNGTTITRNGTTSFEQRTFGWTPDGQLRVRWLDYMVDWPEVFQGVGGYPSLVIDGEVAVEVFEGEPVYSSTDWSNQPRSALGTTIDGQLIFAVADGRNTLSSGIFSQNWAEFLANEFNLSEGIGLDGGGSSTLVVQDCWINSVVNFPSDSSGFSHEGTRTVGSGLYLR